MKTLLDMKVTTINIIQFSRKTILKMYAASNKVSKYIKQKLTELQGEINKFTRVRNFNTSWNLIDQVEERILKHRQFEQHT